MAIIVKCPECGKEFNELIYSQCPECGSIKYKDVKEMVKCSNKQCGAMISKLFTRCPFCGHEIINDTLYYKYEKVYSPQKSKDERSMEETENESSEETTIPRCRAYVNDKQNILLNIFCFLLNFLAWIPYLILKKKHPKMAEGSVFWGLIGSAVLLLGIMMTTGKVNPFCVIMCIVYYVLWRHE